MAAAADYGFHLLRLRSLSTFAVSPTALFGALAGLGLLVAVLLGAVAWLALRRAPHRAAGGLLLLLGLPAAVSPLLFLGNLLRWLPNPLLVAVSQGSHLRLAGAFVAVLGVMVLLRRREAADTIDSE